MKRVVVIGDMHCGHRVGLTPPAWQLNPENENDAKWYKLHAAQWDWYVKTIGRLRPIHLLLVMGDCVEGQGKRADGRDVMRHERGDQVEMARFAIAQAEARHIEMVYGSRYHVRDWEDDLCRLLGDKAKIGAHGWPKVHGVTFDIKHKVGGSSVPHGRLTAVARAKVWNELWAARNRQPDADIILRGHVHYWAYCGGMGAKREWMAMTCPALQDGGTEFGAEQCEGLIDFGLLYFDVHKDGSWERHAEIVVLDEQRAAVSAY